MMLMMKKKPELLAPAGDMERLQMALAYGADAVYLAGNAFGMRAFAGNFDRDELALAELAVSLEKKKMEKDTLLAIFDVVEETLRTQLLAHPAQVLPVLERLHQILHASMFHVGTGHLFGWLITGS